MKAVSGSKYPKGGAAWTQEDLAALARFCSQKLDWQEIGKQLGRTSEACRTKAQMSGIMPAVPRNRAAARKRAYSSCVLS
jgi:hypothetical protein